MELKGPNSQAESYENLLHLKVQAEKLTGESPTSARTLTLKEQKQKSRSISTFQKDILGCLEVQQAQRYGVSIPEQGQEV